MEKGKKRKKKERPNEPISEPREPQVINLIGLRPFIASRLRSRSRLFPCAIEIESKSVVIRRVRRENNLLNEVVVILEDVKRLLLHLNFTG